MSRSYKKTSVIGYTRAFSEKSDKKHAHKVYRKHVKNNIASLHGDVNKLDELIMPIEEELSNIDKSTDDDRMYIFIKKCLRK